MKHLSENFYFYKLPLYLTASLPLLLITGPFLADTAVSLCAILFLINSFFNSLKKYYRSYFFKGFVLFNLILIISSLFSTETLYSLKSSIFYLRFGIFAISIWYLLDLDKDNKLIKYLFSVFIFCFILLIFDGFFQFFTKKNILGWAIDGTRVSSFFKDELILGSYLSRLFPIAFAFYIYLNEKKFTVLICLIFILIEILIFVSGERSAFFFINFTAFFMILMSKNFMKIRLLILISSMIFITAISIFHNNEYKKRIFDKTVNQVFSQKKINIFSVEHENHYKSAILMFKNNPWLGVGPKVFRKLCDKEIYKVSSESCTSHPHNTYIQLLAESGIFSFIQIFLVFISISLFSIKHFYYKYKKKIHIFNDYQLSLISAILVTLWPLIPTGNFFTNWINVVYYLPVGFLLYSLSQKKKS